MKSALKSTEKYSKTWKNTGKYFFSVGFYTDDGDLSQYSIVLPLFGAAYNVVS